MNKLLNVVAAAMMLPLSAQAQDYAKYYQNLPVTMQQVTRPQFPANEVNLKDVGGVGDGPSRRASAN